MTEYRRVPVDPKAKSTNPLPDFGLPTRKPVEPDQAVDCDCPHLDADDWHEVTSDWSDIVFLRGTSTAVMGVPVSYRSASEELRTRARELGWEVADDAMLLLGEGKFRRPILLEVEGDGKDAKDVIRPGGFAYTRLVPAPYGELGRVVDETKKAAKAEHGRNPDECWLWYLTCKYCSGARNFETLVVAHFRAKK